MIRGGLGGGFMGRRWRSVMDDILVLFLQSWLVGCALGFRAVWIVRLML